MKPAKDADELMENMRKVIEDIRSLKRSESEVMMEKL